jgi:acetyl-CoA acetyltransferase
MQPGALGEHWTDRPGTFARFDAVVDELSPESAKIPLALRYFGGAGQEHMKKYGTKLETFAKVRAKASRHAANNPLALLRKVLSEEDVMQSPAMWPGVLTRLMACPPTCGGAAALLVSKSFASRHGLSPKVQILAQAMTTDYPSTFDSKSIINLVGFQLTSNAAKQVYEMAGVGPNDVDVCELHDCFAQNELITYEGLGFCPVGEAERFVESGGNTYGGKVVTNPSGGLLSKGHPLGATGLAQCYELTRQLRGTAEATQAKGAKIALQHNLGLGGAAVVTLYGQV